MRPIASSAHSRRRCCLWHCCLLATFSAAVAAVAASAIASAIADIITAFSLLPWRLGSSVIAKSYLAAAAFIVRP